MRPLLSQHVLLFASILLLVSNAAIAQNGTEDAAIKDARESLGGGGAFPWYDREKDAPRPLNLQRVEDDSENRKSTATATPTAPTTTATPPNLSWLGRMLQIMGIAVLVAILVLAVVLITRAFMNSEVTETTGSKVVETSQDVDRVEHLPFQLRKPTGDFLSEARRLYEAGDYSQAILYLYSHFLVQLDRQHVIRLAKGKTNRQYLRETRSRPVLFPMLEITMISFEDVFFGHHKITREQFEASWNRLSEFEAELSRVERAAA
ncbi:MAG: hypothetical protein K8R36_17020 [Planctomycetales bacterium]|nr:hypothetical protein [Planctomycetales bacterium]